MSGSTTYYADYVQKPIPEQQQLITFSYDEMEKTINGVFLEDPERIYLYEYRGRYIGNEFLISFSKDSIFYKLVKVEDAPSQAKELKPKGFRSLL
ncbi:MAG TPA: hypothetical protein VK483_18035 [Chitinophagaceae bacterium]|nr:hypothetical protein [Chitinophagaceae bacterium]